MKSKELPSWRSRKYEEDKKQKCFLCHEISQDMWELKKHQESRHKEFFDRHEEFYSEWMSKDIQ